MKGSITISRYSTGEIAIRIFDENSRSEFVSFEMTPHNFAVAVTGVAAVEGDFTVRGLANIGLTRVNEDRSIVCPIESYDKEKLAAWLLENAREDGWEIDTYLGSQNSVIRNERGTVLNYRVFKFVEPTP